MTRPEDPEDDLYAQPQQDGDENENQPLEENVFPADLEDFTPINRQALDDSGFGPTLAASPSLESDSSSLSGSRPTRRRRQRSFIVRPSEDEIDGRLDSIARRATPTFDFFIFALLSGALLGIGYILDAPAILLFGLLAAPILSPWIGAILGLTISETRFFGQAMGGLLTGLGMVFLAGLLAGLASRIFMPLTFNQAFLHARLWWTDIALLVAGTAIITYSLIQSEEKPILASLMVAYGLFLPISVAGFGLGNGVSGLWPQAFYVFLVHLCISLLLGLGIFLYMGFRPIHASGYILPGVAAIIALAVVAGFAGFGTLLNNRPAVTIQATPTPAASPTASLSTSSPQASPTRLVSTPTITASPTATPEPTPAYGRVRSPATAQSSAMRRADNPSPRLKTVTWLKSFQIRRKP